MSKIIGVTVGTPTSPATMRKKLNPVTSVNGITPNDDGNVEIPVQGSPVTRYGAKGDGSTDDTVAFQTALADNRVVFVPGGTYVLSGTLTIGANCCLELSQDTVLKFTQTSGNAIVMQGSATLRGNHAILSVPYAFTGNAVAMDTNLETDTIIPPYVKVGSHMFKRQRFVYDLNIIKQTSDGFCRSSNGKCNGTAVYLSATSTAESHMWMWAVSMSGIRIAGAFSYGIRAVNYDSPAGSSGHYEDDAWNHDMRIEAVIEACEVGVSLENCNTAHIAVTVQPSPAMDGTKYAKHGFYISDSKFVDMIGSRVWDWNEKTSLWTAGGEYQHIALMGDCRGLLLDDFLVHATSTDIKELIYTDRESNFDKMTILQEPGSKYFKAVNGEPYFDDGDPQRLAMKSDIDEYFTTERVPGFTDALATAIDKNGNIVGYNKYGGALDSAGNLIDGSATYYGNTGFIACKYGDTIYIQDMALTEGDGYTKAFAYDANFNLLGQNNTAAIIAGTTIQTFSGTVTDDGCTLTPMKTDTAYMRLGFQNKILGSNPVISVNKEIKFVQEGFLTDGIKVKAENIYGDVGGGSGVDVTAEVGQTIIVKAVDENGKPTEWEAAEYQPRTHWSETEETVIFEESEVSWSADTNFAAFPELSEEIVVGSSYKVTHNGTEYILDAVEFEGQIVLGNTGYLSSDGEDNGVPFALIYTAEMTIFLGFNAMSDDESVFVDGSAMLEITKINETVYPIPDKFIKKDFRVTVTANSDMATHTVDKTFSEIAKAVNDGKNITLLYKGIMSTYVYYLTKPSTDSFQFATMTHGSGGITARVAIIASDGTFTTKTSYLNVDA